MRSCFAGGLICAIALVIPFLLPTNDASANGSNARAVVELTATEPFQFNGTDEGLNLGQSSNVNFGEDDDFTVHLTVRFASLTNESGPCFSDTGCDVSLVDKMASPTEVNSDGWRILKQSDNHFWFCLGGGESTNGCDVGTLTTVISITEAVPNLWFSVAAVKRDQTISIYVNGIHEGTIQLGSFSNMDSTDLLIGENGVEGAFLNGLIGEVKLFRRALNRGEIQALYAMTKLTQ